MTRNKTKQNRRNFLKSGVTGLAGAALVPSVLMRSEKSYAGKSALKKDMIYRKLGKTGIKLPVLSIGAGGYDKSLYKAALDSGVTHIDTSQYYQGGRHEELIGEVIKDYPRDSYVIATSILLSRGNPKDDEAFAKKMDSFPLASLFEASLWRLGLDDVDIFYLAGIGNKETALYGPLVEGLKKLKAEGKTRFIGLACHENEPEVIQAAVEGKVHDVVLAAYNFKKQYINELDEAIDLASGEGIGIVAMKTQAGVFWDRERTQPINMKAALKWALQNENITSAIPGISTFDQLETDLSIMENLTLTEEEKADLKPGESMAESGLYCQQCNSCVTQCPEEIDIPELMRSYMYAYGYKNSGKAKETLKNIELSSIPCSTCSTCSVLCSMGFDIREKVLDIARLKDVPDSFLV